MSRVALYGWFQVAIAGGYAIVAAKTPQERVDAGISAMLGLQVPVTVPILEKIPRVELSDVLWSDCAKGCVEGLSHLTVNLPTMVMQTIRLGLLCREPSLK